VAKLCLQVRVHDPHQYACAHTIKTLEPTLTALGLLRRCAECALWSFCTLKSVRPCGMRALSTDHKTQSAGDNHLHSRHQHNARSTPTTTLIPQRCQPSFQCARACSFASHTHARRIHTCATIVSSTTPLPLSAPGASGWFQPAELDCM
jgi:hypothetical protein